MDQADPRTEFCLDDPGDDVQRRFRYQNACGVILLVRMLSESPRPVCLWCEHHEDYLVERADGLYDAHQIKTRKPERGPWTLREDDLVGSLNRFVQLDKRFPGKIGTFSFGSNLDHLITIDRTKIDRSPIALLNALSVAQSDQDLDASWAVVLNGLAGSCGCEAPDLFGVLKRLRLVKTPPLDGYEAVVAHTVLGTTPACQGKRPAELSALRDELIQLVAKASALPYENADDSWRVIAGGTDTDPRLAGKRVNPDRIEQIIRERNPVAFRFTPVQSQILAGSGFGGTALRKKLVRGGLADLVDTMQRRTLSAERHLLELAERSPETVEQLLDQLDSVVKGVCDDERLLASHGSNNPYGRAMYAGVVGELRRKATQEPEMVHGQSFECLIGVAGLLTEECKVWWSPVFDLEDSR